MNETETLLYYNANAIKFTEDTVNVDFSEIQNRFLCILAFWLWFWS